jgi:hypothetical protein
MAVTINPARPDQPASPWAGVWIAEDIELIARGVASRSWVDGSLGVVGAGLDGLAVVSDPVGALLQYGVAWLVEHVRPLSEALDWLAGDPGQIAAQAQVWRGVASSLRVAADGVVRAVRLDLTEWQGPAAEAYRGWAGRRDRSLLALARASDAMALIVEGAGALIGTVREMVRDAVATVVSRLLVYAGELVATAGLAAPLVAGQVSALCASWAAKIARWLRDLIASLRNLLRESERLAQLTELLGGKKTGAAEAPKEPSPRISHPVPPDFSNAELDPAKISGYAMNPDHPVGRNKYRVIHSVTGLDAGDVALIEEQIRDGLRGGAPILGRADEYGQRWAVDLPLTGPNGTITVRTAWIVDAGGTTPRLVTISLPKRNRGTEGS